MILYLDCSNGVSGDMLAAALLDLAGAQPGEEGPFERLVVPALKAAGIDPRLVRLEQATRGGVGALAFRVADAPGFATFDELMLATYASGIDVADVVAAVAQRMAAAESEVHGEETVHLHELSGVDTAVDLITGAVLMRHLAPEQVMASPPALGDGTVHTAHGDLPVPAPAVAALLRGLPVADARESRRPVGELTTPTGAALLAHFVRAFGPPPGGVVIATGRGAGARVLPGRPNVLKAMLIEAAEMSHDQTAGDRSQDAGEPAREPGGGPRPMPTAGPEGDEIGSVEPATRTRRESGMVHDVTQGISDSSQSDARGGSPDEHVVLETNVDDMSPELFAHAADVLRAAGAVDVWATPAYMKKGRPGMILHVLTTAQARDRLAATIFAETSTFGLRVLPVGRIYAEERWATVTIAGREIHVRLAFADGRVVTVSPEFEDVRAVAAAVGRPARIVYEAAQAAARDRFSAGAG
ncbi:MAG TPA: LarC family nickel insertion protein [Thermoleophilia bacterium]|nr:LarC family nickel insertion protein [Thermoleophilia bacterium]